MQGIFVNGRRPKSKKEVKEFAATTPHRARLEATSMFGNEPDGPFDQLPDGKYQFVGPDPYSDRRFYGTITVTNGKIKVS